MKFHAFTFLILSLGLSTLDAFVPILAPTGIHHREVAVAAKPENKKASEDSISRIQDEYKQLRLCKLMAYYVR